MATPRADGDDQPARVIGRYELVSEIAPGALGELWKARIISGPEKGRVVSIRRVPRTGAFDTRAIERLTNAGFAAMEVRHPKIGAVLDFVVADSEIALVSEHMAGALLTTVLRPPSGKRATVSPDVALRIALDVLEALDGVHAQWRDLFPSVETEDDRLLRAAAHGGLVPDSVLLASFGEAMLLDAGLAGIAMTVPPVLERAQVIAYRAPEQLDASGPADERSDVFSVGVLVWELLSGRPLFAPAVMPRPAAAGPGVKTKAFSDAMQVSTVKRKVLTATVQRLDSLPLLKGKVTKAFSDLVAKCLERDPAKRFQTIRELIATINALGPRTVAGYDAVSKLLATAGAAAPAHENAFEPSSGRSTSNRPTVPPEKEANRDTAPPDTRRAAAAGAATATSLEPTPQRTTVETFSDEETRVGPVDSVDEALFEADLKSIPPTADVESLPPATDVESLPPSADSRLTSPAAVPSDAISSDAPSFFPPSPSTDKRPTDHEPLPFAPVLAPPLIGDSRSEEPTSAPVTRPLGSEGGADLTSTLMSSQASGGNKKVVIGIVVVAVVLALVGVIRSATSGRVADPTPLSASSGAIVATPIPSAVEAPAANEPPSAEAESPESPEPAAAKPSEPPTSAPALSPAGVQQVPPKRQQLPQQPAPVKKKPFRPSGI